MSKPDLDIITSPEAQRMLQMVTKGFYDRSRIGLWLFEVIGREYDDIAQWAQELRFEVVPQTCTWSISIWEFVYGIEPDESLPLEFRRQRIIAKKLQRPPINPARIETTLSLLTGDEIRVADPIAPYRFAVEIEAKGQTIDDYKSALAMLRKIKPSHLSFNAGFVANPQGHCTTYAAVAAAGIYTSITVEVAVYGMG